MKVAIIGAGNMGAAIAKSIAVHCPDNVSLSVSNPSCHKLQALKQACQSIHVTTDNVEAARDADVVILAVKPVVYETVLSEMTHVLTPKQIMVTILGGVSLKELDLYLSLSGTQMPIVRVIPDTAISIDKSMTFISSLNASAEEVETVTSLFSHSGEVAIIPERLMDAATALSSCGIAYVYKYVQACVQAGVQMGFRPADALRYVIKTVSGAIDMLEANGETPQQEIDKVTSPGGMTIKGINMLEHCGFTSAVINAILEPLKK